MASWKYVASNAWRSTNSWIEEDSRSTNSEPDAKIHDDDDMSHIYGYSLLIWLHHPCWLPNYDTASWLVAGSITLARNLCMIFPLPRFHLFIEFSVYRLSLLYRGYSFYLRTERGASILYIFFLLSVFLFFQSVCSTWLEVLKDCRCADLTESLWIRNHGSLLTPSSAPLASCQSLATMLHNALSTEMYAGSSLLSHRALADSLYQP